jgi:predicted  nucleic acid-binding Zn-ribbon protein
MSQQDSRGIEVSKEEEQYLRSAFRRFAVPYLFVFAVLAWATTAVMSKDAPTGAGEDLSSLNDKVAALEKSMAGLEERVAKVDADLVRAGTRVGALESRKPSREAAPAADTDALERALRDASRRIADLEKRNGSGATTAERIDALTARMQRIEGLARSFATAAPPAVPTPAPAPMPAAPAPAPAP